MKGHITLDAWTLGPLAVGADYPLIYWEGKRLLGWPDRPLRVIAALIEHSMVPPEDLAAVLGLNTDSLHVRICELRTLLKVSRLPLRIDGVTCPDRRLIQHYRLLLDYVEEEKPNQWLNNRTPADLDRSKRAPAISETVRRRSGTKPILTTREADRDE